MKFYQRTVLALASKKFFGASLILFLIESSWIAIAGLYPMALDENFHFGLIKLYAVKLLPFWSSAPPSSVIYGAVERDPSYMYHYLFSFPYRLMEHFITSPTAQIILFRLLNVLLFGLGIIILRWLLLTTKASKAIVNFVLAVFILTPVVPMLAAQINYDNLVFPCGLLSLLLTIKITDSIKQTKQIDLVKLGWLVSLCLFTCLVKYAFLPIFVGIVIYLVWHIYKPVKQQGFKKVQLESRKNYAKLNKYLKVLLIACLLLFSGLFAERYGYNTWRYHTPVPECDQVLNENTCQLFSPWRRNYRIRLDKLKGNLKPVSKSPYSYVVKIWLPLINKQMFYALNGPDSFYIIGSPLPLPRFFSIIIGISGTLLFIFYNRKLRKKFSLNFLIFIAGIYTLTLLAQQYTDFLHLGLAVAIQARYLVLFLPLFYLLIALSFARLLRSAVIIKALLAWFIISLFLLQGGGAIVFIVRSDNSWYWPIHNVQIISRQLKTFFKTFVIGA